MAGSLGSYSLIRATMLIQQHPQLSWLPAINFGVKVQQARPANLLQGLLAVSFHDGCAEAARVSMHRAAQKTDFWHLASAKRFWM